MVWYFHLWSTFMLKWNGWKKLQRINGLKVFNLTVDELCNSCELRIIHQLHDRLELRLDQVSCRWFYHRVVESELANVGQVGVFKGVQVFLSSRCESNDPVASTNFSTELGHSVEHHVVELINDCYFISHTNFDQTLWGHWEAYGRITYITNFL